MENLLRVGVIGTGWGELQIAAFQRVKNVEVVAVCDADAARVEQIARQFKIERAFTKWEDVVAVTDLVSIAAPTPEHKIICEAALSAGKNVLCEKPLALNARDARAMLGAAEQRKLVHAANFEMRFLPAFQYAKELIDEDYLGEFFRADVTMAMERPWGEHGNWAADDARGGGVLMEVGSHFLDVMRWWFGNARAVLASRRTNFPNVKTRDEQIKGNGKTATTLITADDALWCALQFERGEALLNFVTGARYDPGWTINAYGALGTLVIKSGELLGRRDGDLHLEPLAIPKRLEQNEKPNDPLMWGMVKLFERVAAKILSGESLPFPDFCDGVAVAQMIDAIKRASDAREWIQV